MRVKLDKDAIMPRREHILDGGYDLFSRTSAIIAPHSSWIFDTGVHMEIPAGYVGDVEPRSGTMVRQDILTDGTIDAGYIGSICVKLFNHGTCDFKVEKGQKIAQLVIKKIITPELEEVDELEETDRGINGFGSTGMF
jgi:dUTP pyrophosphatase